MAVPNRPSDPDLMLKGVMQPGAMTGWSTSNVCLFSILFRQISSNWEPTVEEEDVYGEWLNTG